MVIVVYLLVTLALLLPGYSLYKSNHYASGITLLLFGVLASVGLINACTHEFLSFEVYQSIQGWLAWYWVISSIVLFIKSLIDGSRYDKLKETQEQEERNKPLVINITITSTAVEK